MKYISASGTRFEMKMQRAKCKIQRVFIFAFFILHFSFFIGGVNAELIDRVIAFVDERAITLSEFRDIYEKMKKISPDISKDEALNTYINRILLLREAKKLRLEAKTDDEVISSYIELKVKAFIRLKEGDLREFYNSNANDFGGADFDSVRDKIEEYMTEKETNNILKKHINELRSKAYIKILVKEP